MTHQTTIPVQDEEQILPEVLPEKEQLSGHYEILVLISGKASEDVVQTVFGQVKDFLTTEDATITKEEMLGRRALGYTVDGARHGSYFCLEFDLAKNKLQDLRAKLRLKKEINRFLIITKRVKSPEELAEEERVRLKIEERKKKKMKADIAAIEKESLKTPKRPMVTSAPKKEEQANKKNEAEAVTPADSSKPVSKSLEDLDKEIEKILSDDLNI